MLVMSDNIIQILFRGILGVCLFIYLPSISRYRFITISLIQYYVDQNKNFIIIFKGLINFIRALVNLAVIAGELMTSWFRMNLAIKTH